MAIARRRPLSLKSYLEGYDDATDEAEATIDDLREKLGDARLRIEELSRLLTKEE